MNGARSMKSISELNVLVVEDHGFQREYISNTLKQLGVAQVTAAADGHEALDDLDVLATSDFPIDLIVCDLQMPRMDGVSFVRHLADRQFEGSFIILSAMDPTLIASVTTMVRAYKLNFAGAIHKPVDSKVLVKLMREACSDISLDLPVGLPEGVSENDLIEGLNSGGLISYFQPKYDFETRSLYGIEALARLVLPDGRMIYPDDFIYLYKKLGRTREFELSVYKSAFELGSHCLKRGKPLQVSVNFCANMLTDELFFDEVIQLAENADLPSDMVTIEITERSLIEDLKKSIEFLARLRIKGFNLSVDDFGTGYSSIKQLEILPFNELKIDKSFIMGIEKDKQKRAIVQSITELASRMDLKIVAEGVETEEAYTISKNFGCDYCQGFLTGRPVAYEELARIVG